MLKDNSFYRKKILLKKWDIQVNKYICNYGIDLIKKVMIGIC